MKANNSFPCWLLGLVLCLGLYGCMPRAAQLPNHISDSAALASLGSKVEDSDASSSLQIPGQAPGDYSTAKAKFPNSPPSTIKNTTQSSGFHAKIGEPSIPQAAKAPTIQKPSTNTESGTLPNPGRYEGSPKTGITVVANRPSVQPLPVPPVIPDVPKILKEKAPETPRPEIPPELPKTVQAKPVQKPLPELPPVPPEIPAELPKVPPQVEEAPMPPQKTGHQVVDNSKLPPPLPVPTAQKELFPKLPDQPPIPPVEQIVQKKPLPELPPVPPKLEPEKKLPDLPPAPPPVELVKKLPDLPPPAPVPAPVKTEPLPSTPPQVKKESSAPTVIVLERPAKTQPQVPVEPVKPVSAKKDIPEPPAALPPEVKYQTEEPPPLLSAKPLPMNGLQPVSAIAPGKPAGSLEMLHQLATESYATIDSYIVRFRRKEQVGGKDMPEELMLFKFHKKPFSIYFKWLGGGAKGREVVYVNGRHGNKLHTLTAAGDVPFIPPGKRMSFSIDSPLVRAKTRHSINEAGVGKMIERFGNHVEDMKRKDFRFGSLKYLGLVKRPEFENQVEAVLHIIPPKVESALPQGGRRFWYFDTKLRFPVLLITFDEKQHSVEYYCYDRWLFPGRLSEDEFNPNVLWRED